MNSEEAELIARIMLTADGGCLYCACNLIDEMAEKFPEHKSILQKVVSENCNHIVGEND